MGETKKSELERRVEALEEHVKSLGKRLNDANNEILWLRSFHHDMPNDMHHQYVPPPETA